MRTTAGKRARLTKFTAEFPVEREGTHRLPTEGWLALWADGSEFRLAGGAHPTAFDGALTAGEREGLGLNPSGYRNDLLALIRSVE